MRGADPLVRDAYGRSRLCPFIPGEPPSARHRRRHAVALESLPSVRAWCDSRAVMLRVSGSNHPEASAPEGWKWDFRVPGKFAQWRPFAGMLVLKTRLAAGVPLYTIKVYDAEQLLDALGRWLLATGDTL